MLLSEDAGMVEGATIWRRLLDEIGDAGKARAAPVYSKIERALNEVNMVG